MIIQPIEKNKLSHQITESLLGMITNHTLIPGQKLPTEMELAASYNVSRNVVRESLKTLELLGITESKTSRGTFITANAIENLYQYEFWSTLKSNVDIVQLFEARLALEPELAYLAALKRTDEDLKNMRDFLDNKITADYNTYGEYFDDTYMFHFLVAKASKNQIMETFLKTIHKHIKEPEALQFSVDHSIGKNKASHEKIYQAILQQQAPKAKSLMFEHILPVYRFLNENENLNFPDASSNI